MTVKKKQLPWTSRKHSHLLLHCKLS